MTRVMRWLLWKLGRGLYAFDSLVLNYKRSGFTRFRERLWPKEYSRECPGWAMRVK